MKTSIWVTLGIAMVAAPVAAAPSAQERAQALKSWSVCLEAGRLMRQKKRAEDYFDAVIARARTEYGLNGVDLMHAPDRRPGIGMSACGLLAALGRPAQLNRTERRAGMTAQWVYQAPRRYIYTDTNQIVTTIQD